MDTILLSLNGIDWSVIASFFIVTLLISLYFSKKATASMDDFFVAGRKMTWWLAGTSIVATSFAADTPLVIAGWIRTSGLERNWFWWGGIMGMMLCTFFFARLWRRANILTDVEFNELRYGGVPAAGLRMFHAGYRSLIQNTLVMGWVTLAMAKILDVTLNLPTLVFVQDQFLPMFVAKGTIVSSVVDLSSVAVWPLIGQAIIPAKATGIIICLGVAAIYSALSGLWGVIATDFFQFSLAMLGTFILMFVCFSIAGGPKELTRRAEEAVNGGLVRNRATCERYVLDTEGMDPPLAKCTTKLLLDAGLATAEENNSLVWNAENMPFNQIAAQLRDQGALTAHIQGVWDLWEKAYVIHPHKMQQLDKIEPLLAGGFLVAEKDASVGDYYRATTVALSEKQLLDMLESKGIDQKGDFMAVWRHDTVVPPMKITSFLPPFDLKGGGLLAVWSLIVFLGLQWWAGGEGGGFLAQRLFSCKNEKESVLAMLWYNFANFVLRPWPWIVVGVASLFLIPDITAYGSQYDAEHAYVIMLMKCLPSGIKGLLVASLMAAYMSTISTHVNFGASYVINDIYKRFIHRNASERHTIIFSQVISILLAVLAGVYAYSSESVSTGWFMMFELMSGVGFVVLLRWYWWRISAWSELAAMFSSLGMYCLLNFTPVFTGLFDLLGIPVYLLDEYAVRFTLNMLCTTIVWVTVTILTPPEKEEVLVRFFKRIRPAGSWKPIAEKAGIDHGIHVGKTEWICWALGCASLFTMIFCVGNLCFGRYLASFLYAIVSAVMCTLIFRLLRTMDWTSLNTTDETPPPINVIVPPLDPEFVSPALFMRAYSKRVEQAKATDRVILALERNDNLISRYEHTILPCPANSPCRETLFLVERLVKFMLWSRSGWRLYIAAPDCVVEHIQYCYNADGPRAFDCDMMQRIYERPFEIQPCSPDTIPEENERSLDLGGHLDGYRIGFDLGASDFKLAAVDQGNPVFTTEIAWDPKPQDDPDYHRKLITDGLKTAASYLPRVDCIGGSSAGVYLNNRPMVASIFRSLSADDFENRAKPMFVDIGKDWKVPLQIINDGEVTALAGGMSLNAGSLLGIAMGSSLAAGYLNRDQAITGWLNELCFVPVDFNAEASIDEWSGDFGAGATYFSQQAVARLAPKAGIDLPESMSLPKRLLEVQKLMAQDDPRAKLVYETIGTYLGYTIPFYATFYPIEHILLLGRVMTGTGGDIIRQSALHVLKNEFSELAETVTIHIPDEQSKRHGQAVAAASLPQLKEKE